MLNKRDFLLFVVLRVWSILDLLPHCGWHLKIYTFFLCPHLSDLCLTFCFENSNILWCDATESCIKILFLKNNLFFSSWPIQLPKMAVFYDLKYTLHYFSTSKLFKKKYVQKTQFLPICLPFLNGFTFSINLLPWVQCWCIVWLLIGQKHSTYFSVLVITNISLYNFHLNIFLDLCSNKK